MHNNNAGNTSDFGGIHDAHQEHNSYMGEKQEDKDIEHSSNKSVSLDDQTLGKLKLNMNMGMQG